MCSNNMSNKFAPKCDSWKLTELFQKSTDYFFCEQGVSNY